MEILQVSAYAGSTGGNHIASLLRLEKSMEERGFKTVYALLDTVREYEWCKQLQKQSTVYFLPVERARIRFDTYRKMTQIFKNHDIQIVHSHFELYDIPVVVTAPKNVKVFWHLHDALEELYAKASYSRKILTRVQYKLFTKSVKIISVARKHGEFVSKLGCDYKKVIYVSNGIDLSRILPAEGKGSRSTFLMFSWDYFRKGVDLAVKASDTLISEGLSLTLALVPGNVPQSHPFIQSVPPENNVNLLFSKAGCFLHLSRAEGLSYALLEAIYSGIPVICSDIPENMPVKECPTVLIVPSENVERITHIMKKFLLGEIEFSTEDIEISRDIISTRFSIEKWITNIMDIYFEE